MIQGLVFDPERHKYALEGVDLPGVTKVLAPLKDFSHVDPEVLQKAADFGHAVHKMVELYLKEELDFSALDEALYGPLEALEKWLREVKPFDRPGVLIDVKSRPYDRVSDPVQLGAYNQLVIENEVREVTIEEPLASAKHRFAGTPDVIIPDGGKPITDWRILYLGLDGKYTYTRAYDHNAWPVFGRLLADYWRNIETETIINSWRNRI